MAEWKILPKVSEDLTLQLLFNRGIKTDIEKEEFFHPSLSLYEKDLEISGIPAAQKRIQKAIKGGELVIIYGDYDVDGVCASAILYKAFSSLGAKVLPYIPHRNKEGYGLSKPGLEFARDSGATVVITVDNGIVALEQAKFAKELGLDLIITDHHLPLDEKPEAFTIVHSTKMCGAAVAWCLTREMVKEDLSKELLQFVAVATVTDLLPLVGLGRAFVSEGLKVLKKTQNPGFLELSQQAGVDISKIGSYEIGHIIGPRLNAIGRLEHAIDALRLLCTKDSGRARKLAQLLCDANSKRQRLTTEAVDQARILVESNGEKKIHVLDSKEWMPGIIGLIAARICEENYCPAVAISVGETHSKGSARSIKGVNIIEVIRECKDLLIDVGGHAGAAGFSLINQNIPIFRERLEKMMESYEPKQILEIEAQVTLSQLTEKLIREIDRMEPFGVGNPRPLLCSLNLKVSDIRTVGEGKHLKFKISSSVILNPAKPNGGSNFIDCIAFGMGKLVDRVSPGQLVNLAFCPEINQFNGHESLQLKIKDLQIVC